MGKESDGMVFADKDGNLYRVERAVRNGAWVAVRINAGGHRKMFKGVEPQKSARAAETELAAAAEARGWDRVVE